MESHTLTSDPQLLNDSGNITSSQPETSSSSSLTSFPNWSGKLCNLLSPQYKNYYTRYWWHDFSTFWPSILSTGISHLVVCTIHLSWNKNNQRIIKDFAMQWMNAHNKWNLCQNMIKKVKGWNGIQRQICTAYILHTLDIIKWVDSLTVELVLVVCLVFRLRKVELLYDY